MAPQTTALIAPRYPRLQPLRASTKWCEMSFSMILGKKLVVFYAFVAKKLEIVLAPQTTALIAPRYPLLQLFRRVNQMVRNEFYHDYRT